MNALDQFEFSQSSLQDFVDCRRRFWLRYVQRLAWPALSATPALENERHMQRGERFHRLVQQYLLNIPPQRLARIAAADHDEHLLGWWQNFERQVQPLLAAERFVECALAAPFGRRRLTAKYDLLQILPNGRLQIYDWKTSLRRPRANTLRARLQSRVYPYLLVLAGSVLLNGRKIQPEQIEMIYWFADPDQLPEHMPYSQEQYLADENYLFGLLHEMDALPPDGYTMAERHENCTYCVYRSLCDRGTDAGDLQDDAFMDESPSTNDAPFNLEQIAEISF